MNELWNDPLIDERKIIRDLTTPTRYCISQVQGICWNYSEFRPHLPASLHTQNVLSIFTQYFTNYMASDNYRINYKVARLLYKVRSTGSPVYLLPSASDYAPTQNIRSSSQYLLNVPDVWTQIGRLDFSHAALSVWNDLPVDIRLSESFDRFQTATRTHFFRLVFINWSCDCFCSYD